MKRLLLVLLTITFATTMLAQVKVYTPTLKSPANDAIDQMPDAYLSWNAITGSLGLQYRVQIDTTMAFNSPLLMDTTQILLTGYKTRLLLFGQKYYWRVQAIDLGQTSYWSEVWNFMVFDQVSLSKPANAATKQAPNVSIEWKGTLGGTNTALTGFTNFDYEIDIDTNFNSPGLITGSTIKSVLKAATSSLFCGQVYYWRVRARHAAGHSSWSIPWSFTVTNTIELDKPADNAADQMLNVQLKWKNPGGFLAFQYEIATDPAFANLVVASEVDTLLVNAEMLLFGTKYYWRVRGRHLHDTTDWATARSFTTINTVLLKTPSDAQTGISVTPTFTWTAQTAINMFQIQVSEFPDFSTNLIDYKPAATDVSYKSTKKLKSQTTYYWRMRAMSNGGVLADTTDWSEERSFVTGNATGIGENEGKQLSLYPNPAHNKVNLRFDAEGSSMASYEVIDLVGKTVIKGEMTLDHGTNIEEINLTGLRKGYYILRLQAEGTTLNHKLIVE